MQTRDNGEQLSRPNNPDGIGWTSQTIHARFEQQVSRTPDSSALVMGDLQITYRQLNARANRIAHTLQARYRERWGKRLAPDTLVALSVDRGFDMIAGMLGVLKSGGAYVPLDPAYPEERLNFMLLDSAAPYLLTEGKYLGRWAAYAGDAICLDALHEGVADDESSNPSSEARGQDLAYVIYTSGSTGKPKGVMIEHEGVLNLAHIGQTLFDVNSSSRVLQIASMSFDVAVAEWVFALTQGATLCLVQSKEELLGRAFVETCRRHRISFATLGPTHLDTVPTTAELPDLKTLVLGGETAEISTLDAWASKGVAVFNTYGPTEATVDATVLRYERGVVRNVIGRPMPNKTAYVLDDAFQPCPDGVVGELFLGGMGIARGYLNRPDLTKERFVPNPFVTPEEKARGENAVLYRTGDFACWRPDGDLEFRGRRDHQVKIRGFRVELDEIEIALREHPAVRDAVVVVREDRPGDKQLVAYYVRAPEEQTPDLRASLLKRLPDYMVPAVFVEVPALPVGPNGKLDRLSLPPPAADTLRSAGYVEPSTPLEHELASLWSSVLNVAHVGTNENFFSLGGHSLLVMKVANQLCQRFGEQVAHVSVFAHPTIRSLAAALEPYAAVGPKVLAPAALGLRIDARRTQDRAPLSFAQERLWFLDRYEQGRATAYNISEVIRLHGPLDVEALSWGLLDVVSRHESLRTTFHEEDGQPYQLISSDAGKPCLPVHDLTALVSAGADSEREKVIDQFLADEVHTPFDLEAGPLTRARLLKLASEEHLLLITHHHIISDARSLAIFFRELSLHYNARVKGANLARLPQRIRYSDFAIAQREWLQGEVLTRQLEYWKRALEGYEDIDLPTDYPRPAEQTFQGDSYVQELSAELTRALRRLSKEQNTSLFAVLFATFNVLLCRYGGQTDSVVGVPIANRHYSGVDDLIGFFVNTLPLRARVRAAQTFSELLSEITTDAFEAFQHQDTPLEKIVDALQVTRDISRTPLFQTLFVLQNSVDVDELVPHLDGVAASRVRQRHAKAKFDLTLEIWEETPGAGITCNLEFNSNLFTEATIRRLLQHYVELLSCVTRDPHQRVHDLKMLSDAEYQELVVARNQTDYVGSSDALVHEIFEKRVQLAPQSIALMFGERRVTYAELNAQANRLAHHLIALGVRPDTRVAVCMERSIELIVGMLAILKAGGAYVPIDTSYPDERIRVILDETGALLILGHAPSRARLAMHSPKRLEIDAALSGISTEHSENPEVRMLPDNLAYVICTSGSTFKPKGVMCRHASVACMTAEWQRELVLTRDDRVLQHISIGFDVSVEEIFHPLLVGACLIISPPDAHRDPRDLMEVAHQYGATVIHLVPSMLGAILELVDPSKLESLRKVIMGGEALPPRLVAEFARVSDGELLNAYGPTEAWYTSVWNCTGKEVPARVPIGRPVGDTQMYVLDSDMQLVPSGIPGELYIAGAHLSRGYCGRPDLTAERFVPNPFSSVPGSRMYRTGDLVRWLPDGELDFLGRVDFQVKVRGYRIELSEVEGALRAHAVVKDAAVVARELRPGDTQLIAYLILKDGSGNEALSDAIWREHLARYLPEYMIPGAFVALPSFPLSPNGKLDRKALPLVDPSVCRSGSDYVAPRTPVERRLAEIWSEVLGCEKVGVHDDFFSIGGHSLLAMRVASGVLRSYGVNLPIKSIFREPTIASLASHVARAFDSTWESQASPLALAAGHGRRELVRSFLKRGVSVNAGDKYGRTPLLIAIAEGHAEVVTLLLQSGADVNQARRDGTTPLSAAIERGDPRMISEIRDRVAANGHEGSP